MNNENFTYDQDPTINPELIAQQIEAEFNKLPDTVATQMMKGYVDGYIKGARQGSENWADSLFFAGLGLVHAQCQNGQLDIAEKVGSGYYIPNSHGWDKTEFAHLSIPAYISGFQKAKSVVPTTVQTMIADLYPHWFEMRYDMDFSQEKVDYLLQPNPIVMPFDHYSQQRSFIGGRFHYPNIYNRPTFSYMKADEYPPTIWYSDRSENDFEGYVTKKADNLGISVQTAIEETGCHEGAHLLSIDPAVAIAMNGNKHCWLTEAFPQYYGEEKTTLSNKLAELELNQSPLQIADTEGRPVNYSASLLLTMSMAAKLAGSESNIADGMEQIVKKVADKAHRIVDGDSQIASPLELLFFLDPSLRHQIEQENLIKIMDSVKRNFDKKIEDELL